ncbi:septal ring lytic transglycosylase RlpA family protein [Chromatium okenii]|jgi:rare lipoprotein A|uniref:Endolytic peptidoglycan transglycosylase RlpA n=1 Tax=Chromatium okenii TaxID=61644 RepID=A0A2S7XMM4_9GAMM|nr:septal ring lytic transglycosylase RlpA family protein [Chromatium okenii]MBV5309884.1 septal ring lytic transglycosylase RlpA family protein [Chromatium okenii]PQJ94989.1 septal ring lytic transglycosylase RlpA family lipoprotein [Chromatium okenii]
MKKTLATAALLTLFFPVISDAQAGSGQTQKGMASYYHDRFHGRKTASGQRYNRNRFTAAHKTLPLGTKLEVTNTRNGRSIVVQVNDRGPFAKGRVLDLSREAASELGMLSRGVARIEYRVVSSPARTSS